MTLTGLRELEYFICCLMARLLTQTPSGVLVALALPGRQSMDHPSGSSAVVPAQHPGCKWLFLGVLSLEGRVVLNRLRVGNLGRT